MVPRNSRNSNLASLSSMLLSVLPTWVILPWQAFLSRENFRPFCSRRLASSSAHLCHSCWRSQHLIRFVFFFIDLILANKLRRSALVGCGSNSNTSSGLGSTRGCDLARVHRVRIEGGFRSLMRQQRGSLSTAMLSDATEARKAGCVSDGALKSTINAVCRKGARFIPVAVFVYHY